MLTKTIAIYLVLTVAALANGVQSNAEWVRYVSIEGRYSVLVPNQPKLSSQESPNQAGYTLTQYMAQAMDADGVFMTGYFDLPSDMTYSLDKGRDGFVSAVKGTLLSEEAVSLGGQPGRELKVVAKKAEYEFLIRARVYHVGKRVYIIQHLFLKSTDSPVIAAKTAKFFDSFKVTTGY